MHNLKPLFRVQHLLLAPEVLSELMEMKDEEALERYGGPKGVTTALCSDTVSGLDDGAFLRHKRQRCAKRMYNILKRIPN